MRRVMIIGSSFQLQEEMESVMAESRRQSFAIETSASFGQTSHWWFVSGPDVLVLDIPEDPQLLNAFVQKALADLPKSLPLVVICHEPVREVMQLGQHFNRMRVVSRPAKASFVLRALSDLAPASNLGPTQPRFLTDIEVDVKVESGASRNLIPAKIKNISLGGLYCETKSEHSSIQPGAILQFVVPQSSGQLEFRSRIVWLKRLAADAHTGFGCKYLDEDARELQLRLDRLVRRKKEN